MRVQNWKAISVFPCPPHMSWYFEAMNESEGKRSKTSKGNRSQLNTPLCTALTRIGRTHSGAVVILSHWLIKNFKTISPFHSPSCSRWKREIWTHSLQGYYCPRSQWSWEWPGGHSQVPGFSRLTAWLSPLCWHSLWYFGSWQHAW